MIKGLVRFNGVVVRESKKRDLTCAQTTGSKLRVQLRVYVCMCVCVYVCMCVCACVCVCRCAGGGRTQIGMLDDVTSLFRRYIAFMRIFIKSSE